MKLLCQIVLERIDILKMSKVYNGTYCEYHLSRSDIDIIELHGHRVYYRDCDMYPFYIHIDGMCTNLSINIHTISNQ